MKTNKFTKAVCFIVATVALMAICAVRAAQPVIYTLDLTPNLNASAGTFYVTNPVWTTSSGGTLTNLDVVQQSQFTLYAILQAGPTNGVVNAGTNGVVTVSGLVSPDNTYFTATNAPASFTVGMNTNATVIAMPYSNQPATSWRYWGGVLTVTIASTNYSVGANFTNSTFKLKSFWKAP